MTDNDFHRELLSRLRAISNYCIDPWAIERLRIMAAEIEQRLGLAPTIGTDDNSAEGATRLRVRNLRLAGLLKTVVQRCQQPLVPSARRLTKRL